MMSKVFIDTNILVYCLDQSHSEKRDRCRYLIREVITEGRGVISTQVIQEFYVAATKKLGADPLLVKDIITSLERLETVVVTPAIIKEAIDCAIINRFSFWDSLIIAAAESAKCDSLWTEDLNIGQIVRSVRVINPL
jgi:predicted nucleic acid-binding protein